MRIFVAILVIGFMVVILPMYDELWVSVVYPMLDTTPGMSTAEDLFWRYFPYIFMGFLVIAAFYTIIRGRSQS